MTLRIHLLGDFSLAYKGIPCATVNRVRLQSLLAYLLLHRQAPQPRQHLAFQLWPDSTERQARNNLRKALHQLRQRLPDADNFLQVDAHTVQWRSDAAYTLDVAEFETKLRQGAALSDDPQAQQTTWEEAVALYGGDLLPACYDEWIFPERERLRQAFIETLERLVWLAEDQFQYAAAIRHANHLLRYDPLHEATYRRLMRLHAVCGDRANALQVYQTCVTVLRRELDVEPGPDIQRAYARLLEMEVPTRLRTHAASPSQAADRLVGRADAWQTLQAAWQRTVQGDVHFCLIRGEAGIGKTRLAEELLTWVARQGMATARTRSYAAAGELVYAPVIEWLRSEAIYPALETLDAVWLREAARLLPELMVEHPHVPPPEPWASAGPGVWQRHRLFEALARAVLAASQAKLLLIDDLQWCDAETLAWLHYLLHFAQDADTSDRTQLLIVGTVRPKEVSDEHPLTPQRREWRRAGWLTELDLAHLNEQHTTELAQQIATADLDAETARALHAYTGGNPFFVLETLRSEDWSDMVRTAAADTDAPVSVAHAAPLPPKIYTLIQARLAQLSAEARDLVALAAVVGSAFSFELLHRASQVEEGDVARTLDELWRRGIIREQETLHYDFSHDRIREAAYAAIGPVQRPLLHRRVAGALEQMHADDLDPVSVQLAAHYEQADELEKAVDYYQRAAAVAHARFADAEAVDRLYQALNLLERLPTTQRNQKSELAILLQLREPLMVARGYSEPALGEIGKRATVLAREVGDPIQRFRALRILRLFYMMHGNYAKAQSLSEKAVALVDQLQPHKPPSSNKDSKLFMEAHYPLAHALFYQGEFVAAQEHFDQILCLESLPVQPLTFGAMNAWMLGYPDRARHLACRALLMSRNRDDPHVSVFATTNVARLHLFMCHLNEMKPLIEKTIRLAEMYEMFSFLILGRMFQGRLWTEAGKTECGIAQIEAVLAQLDTQHHTAFRAHFLGLLAECQARAGQFAPALETLDRALSFVERNGEGVWHAELLRLRGAYRLVQGMPVAEVEEEYQQAIAVARQQSAKSLELRATVSLARLWQQQDRAAEAHALLAEIYGWFTEGFNTHDLQEARLLLAVLS